MDYNWIYIDENTIYYHLYSCMSTCSIVTSNKVELLLVSCATAGCGLLFPLRPPFITQKL
jgi:hypothetical protein